MPLEFNIKLGIFTHTSNIGNAHIADRFCFVFVTQFQQQENSQSNLHLDYSCANKLNKAHVQAQALSRSVVTVGLWVRKKILKLLYLIQVQLQDCRMQQEFSQFFYTVVLLIFFHQYYFEIFGKKCLTRGGSGSSICNCKFPNKKI